MKDNKLYSTTAPTFLLLFLANATKIIEMRRRSPRYEPIFF